MTQQKVLDEICYLFRLDKTSIRKTSEDFGSELEEALQGKKSSLHILPSFLSSPSGNERGEYVTVDFGGTNIRAMLVSLRGKGQYSVLNEVRKPLKDPNNYYDLTRENTSVEEIFYFIAKLVSQVVQGQREYLLGLTFSYPMYQESVDKARLIHWTKELKPSHSVGRDIGDLLYTSLLQCGVKRVTPVAIINDSVASFLSGAYQNSAVCIGSICGTGHNTCYLEPTVKMSNGQPMIINIESGNFAMVPSNHYDELLDAKSEDPGGQRLEKMVAGKYMGELFRMVLLDLIEKDVLRWQIPINHRLNQPFSLSTEVLGWLYADTPQDRLLIGEWLKVNNIVAPNEQEISMLKILSEAILDRSIKLIAASYIAVFNRLSFLNNAGKSIAVDGAVFKNIHGFTAGIEKILHKIPVKIIVTQNGSNIGAAVAASMTMRV